MANKIDYLAYEPTPEEMKSIRSRIRRLVQALIDLGYAWDEIRALATTSMNCYLSNIHKTTVVASFWTNIKLSDQIDVWESNWAENNNK